jgi:hypothetical protein
MPFKRRLRLVFVALDHPDWAQEAVDLTEDTVWERIKARAASPAETGVLEWADLVLALEDSAARALPALPSRVQVRHLDLAGNAGGRAVQIVQRLSSIVGGLELLARGDGE